MKSSGNFFVRTCREFDANNFWRIRILRFGRAKEMDPDQLPSKVWLAMVACPKFGYPGPKFGHPGPRFRIL